MAERRRGDPGGIRGLLELIGEHRGAFEYDWRARFRLPLDVVGAGMGWGEAVRLTKVLAADPSSAVFAAAQGWDYPLGHEAILLAELLDRFTEVNYKKPKPFQRPWPTGPGRGTVRAGKASYTSRELDAVLAAHRAAAAVVEQPVGSLSERASGPAPSA